MASGGPPRKPKTHDDPVFHDDDRQPLEIPTPYRSADRVGIRPTHLGPQRKLYRHELVAESIGCRGFDNAQGTGFSGACRTKDTIRLMVTPIGSRVAAPRQPFGDEVVVARSLIDSLALAVIRLQRM